jgi:hypothetical protein
VQRPLRLAVAQVLHADTGPALCPGKDTNENLLARSQESFLKSPIVAERICPDIFAVAVEEIQPRFVVDELKNTREISTVGGLLRRLSSPTSTCGHGAASWRI